jgi:hypothetical protein
MGKAELMSDQLGLWTEHAADLKPIDDADVKKFIDVLGWGKRSALRAHEIAKQLGCDDNSRQNNVRRMKQIAIEIGHPVGSLRSCGYFLIETQEELDEVTRELLNQVRGLQRTVQKTVSNYMESR